MEHSDASTRAREAAAAAAAQRITEGAVVGFGSGRAVWATIAKVVECGTAIRAAVASERTAEVARDAGIEVVELDGELRLELAIDGADEIDPGLGLLKGGGGALLREKIVVAAADRFVVVAEASKRVERLGQGFKLPVEVVRFGWRDTRRRLLELVPGAELRMAGGGEYATDEGHYILDCEVPATGDLAELGDRINTTPGVVEHGFFLDEADEVILGLPDGGTETLTR